MLCQTYKELLISSKKESRIADMIYNRNSTAIFTYVASPTKSSAVPVSLSISLIIKSVVRSDTVKTKFSFHSGLVPFPVCQRSYICNHKQKFEPPNIFVCRIIMNFFALVNQDTNVQHSRKLFLPHNCLHVTYEHYFITILVFQLGMLSYMNYSLFKGMSLNS